MSTFLDYPDLDLTSTEFKKKASEIYKRFRENDPVPAITMQSGERAWLFTRYEDVEKILQDNERITKDKSSLPPFKDSYKQLPRFFQIYDRQVAYRDPPDHSRIRRLISYAFTPKVVAAMESRIQQIANELLDQAQDKGEMDLIHEYAFLLPIYVICDLLGVPKEDNEKINRLSIKIVESVSNTAKKMEYVPYYQELVDYMSNLVETKRKSLQNDVISSLIQAHEENDRLSFDEIVGVSIGLLIPGHETTVSLIGNGIFTLHQHPDQLDLFKNNKSLTSSTLDEILRYYPSLDIPTTRWAKQDFEVYGKQIKMGDIVLAGIFSANRDPNKFENPDVFDITRQENEHLSFGKGIHFCPGSNLAKLTGGIGIRTVIERFPNLQIETSFEELTYPKSISARTPVSIRVTF